MFRSLETKLYRWLKRRRDGRALRGNAKAMLAPDSQAHERSQMWARGVLAAIAARKDICIQCMQPFDPWESTQGQRFHLRAILGIPDRELDPKLCRSCYDRSIETYNPRYTMPGTSNSGPPNLVLIDKYANGSKNHG